MILRCSWHCNPKPYIHMFPAPCFDLSVVSDDMLTIYERFNICLHILSICYMYICVFFIWLQWLTPDHVVAHARPCIRPAALYPRHSSSGESRCLVYQALLPPCCPRIGWSDLLQRFTGYGIGTCSGCANSFRGMVRFGGLYPTLRWCTYMYMRCTMHMRFVVQVWAMLKKVWAMQGEVIYNKRFPLMYQ